MKHTFTRALALIIALLLAMPTFVIAEDDFPAGDLEPAVVEIGDLTLEELEEEMTSSGDQKPSSDGEGSEDDSPDPQEPSPDGESAAPQEPSPLGKVPPEGADEVPSDASPAAPGAETPAGAEIVFDDGDDPASPDPQEPSPLGKVPPEGADEVPSGDPAPLAALEEESEELTDEETASEEAALRGGGTCGDGLSWSLDGNGTLTITGTGEMENYDKDTKAPWYDGNHSINSAVIGDGVTTIGAYAFYNDKNLSRITIPDSVTGIGTDAFKHCDSLANIYYGGTPEGWSKISDISGVANDTAIHYPCGESVFWTLDNSGTLTITGTGAMYDYDDTNNKAPWYEYVDFVNSVVIGDDVTTIGKYAFMDRVLLQSVTIPSGLRSIGEGAFQGCNDLTDIYIYYGGSWFQWSNLTGNENVPNSAKIRCTKCGDNLLWSLSGTGDNLTLTITGTGAMDDYNTPSSTPWDDRKYDIKTIAIGNSVTTIGDFAFGLCQYVTGVSIGSGVTSIGKSAFFDCISLTGLTIPNGVTSIGESAFFNCTGLKTVTISDSVTTIGDGAFKFCENLQSVTIPASVNTIGEDAFEGCTKLADIYYGGTPENCPSLASGAGVPDAAAIHYANSACGDNLAWSLTGAGTLTITGTGAMYDYNDTDKKAPWAGSRASITSVDIGDSVTHIGSYAFNGFTNIFDIALPASVTSIGSYAFIGCTNIFDIALPASVTSIGTGAFKGCNNLDAIYYPGTCADWYALNSDSDSILPDCLQGHYGAFIGAVANNPTLGSVAGGGLYKTSSEVTLTATPASGCTFVNWTGGEIEDSTDATYTFTASTDVDLTANFAAPHVHGDVTFLPTDKLPTEKGDYFLTADVTLTQNWNPPSGETRICLNGHAIRTGSDYIVVGSGATLEIFDDKAQDGKITSTQANAVYTDGGAFALRGGTIQNLESGFNSVGVLVASGSFTMAGGAVTDFNINGVAVLNGTFSVSGAPAVIENKHNVYLATDKTITIADKLTDSDKKIGVMMVAPGVFTTGWKDKMGDADPADYFVSDDPAYAVRLNADGEAALMPIDWAGLQAAINAAGATAKTFTLSDYADENKMVTAKAADGPLTIGNGQNITLDLDGCTLDRALTEAKDGGNVITVNGNLTLTDTSAAKTGVVTGGKNSFSGGGVIVNGKLRLEGGTISGNTAEYGGGVYISKNGECEMTDGAIRENRAENNKPDRGAGGGVYMDCGAFTMSGGAITENYAGGSGGGLEAGVVNGVYPTLNFSGSAKITGNTSSQGVSNLYMYAQGLRFNVVDKLDGAKIGVSMGFPGVFTKDWKDKMGDADPADYFASDDPAYNVYLNADGEAILSDHTHTVVKPDGTTQTIGFINWNDDLAKAQNGNSATASTSLPKYSGNYYLAADVTLDDTWESPQGEVNLCLNGKKIIIDNATVNTYAITVNSGATLNIYDENDTGEITQATGRHCNGVEVQGGAFNLHGGKIAGFAATSEGSGGRGVQINTKGTFTMRGGVITGNGASGVYINDGTFTMKGGKITDNSTTVEYGSGGGVYVADTFNLEGGEISGNHASLHGGGVMVAAMGKFNVSGAPVVTGNTLSDAKTASNVWLISNKTINVAGALTDDAQIGVNMEVPGAFTSGLSGKGEAGNFTSDNAAYGVKLTDGGEAELAQRKVTAQITGIEGIDGIVTFSLTAENGYSGTMELTEGKDYSLDAPYGQKVTLTAGVLDGCTFMNWTENGQEVGTDPAIQWTLAADRTLVANYLQNEIVVAVDFQGRDWADGDEFTFTLSSEDDNAQMPAATEITINKNTANHALSFGRISFALGDAGKTFTYKVTQTAGQIPGVAYDDEPTKTIAYTVTERSSGGTIVLSPSPVQQVTFTNVYAPTTEPNITTEPVDLSLTYGYTDGNVLSVAVEELSDHTYDYQWYSCDGDGGNAKKIDGETGKTYTVPTGKNADTEEYCYCEVTATRLYEAKAKNTRVAKVTVGPAAVTLTADSRDTDVYDGTAKTVTGFTCSVEGLTFANTVTASGSGTNAGEYDVTFSGTEVDVTRDTTGNYLVTALTNGKLTIQRRPLTITTYSASKPYDGKMLTNSSASITGLVSGETATVYGIGSRTEVGSSGNPYGIQWGTAKEGNYEITSVSAGILTVTRNNAEITLTAPSDSKTYDGEPLTCDGTGEKKVVATGLPEGFTVEATASGSQTDAGTGENVVDDGYVIKNSAGEVRTANFTNVKKANGALTVEPKAIDGAEVTLSATELSYSGAEQRVTVTGVTLDGKALAAADYDASGDLSGTDANTYTVTVTGKGNYTGTATAAWKIVPGAMGVSAADVTTAYDGQPHGIEVKVTEPASGYAVKYGATEGTYDQDASPTLTDAGTLIVYYKVIAPNYDDFTGSAKVTVEPKAVTATIKLSQDSCTYDGTAHTPGVTALDGETVIPAAEYTVNYSNNTNAGTATVTVTDATGGNYAVSGSATFAIQPATVAVTADAKGKVEGEKDPALTYQATGLIGSDALTGSLSREAGEKPGSYAITQGTLKATDNYAIAFTGATFTISPKATTAPTTAPTTQPTTKPTTEPTKPTTAPTTEPTAAPTTAPTPKPANPGMTLLLLAKTSGSTKLKLSWTKVTGAEGYDVFFARCGQKYELLDGVPASKPRSYTVAGLTKGKAYMARVRAWRMNGKKKTYIGKYSPAIHVIAGGYTKKWTNAKKITVAQPKVTLSAGETSAIQAEVTGAKSGRTLLRHVRALRYYSSDRNVATVDKNGVITAAGPGTCTIYVIANNGVRAKVKVKVK